MQLMVGHNRAWLVSLFCCFHRRIVLPTGCGCHFVSFFLYVLNVCFTPVVSLLNSSQACCVQLVFFLDFSQESCVPLAFFFRSVISLLYPPLHWQLRPLSYRRCTCCLKLPLPSSLLLSPPSTRPGRSPQHWASWRGRTSSFG